MEQHCLHLEHVDCVVEIFILLFKLLPPTPPYYPLLPRGPWSGILPGGPLCSLPGGPLGGGPGRFISCGGLPRPLISCGGICSPRRS